MTKATWTLLAESARLQRSSQCLSVLGSQAWVFGGEVVPRQPVDNRLDVINVAKNPPGERVTTLQAPSPAPSPRVGATSAVVKDALYYFSGRGGIAMAPVEEKGGVWRYTPSTSSWKLLAPADPAAAYPAGRSYHATASDGSDTVFIHAGCPEDGRLADLWAYSVSGQTWKELAPAPATGRGGASIALSTDGAKLYRANGFDGKTEQGGAVDVLDLSAGKWETIRYEPDGVSGPEARSVSALLAVKLAGRAADQLVTLFGEHDPSSLGHAGAGKMLSNVWAFDTAARTWSKVETSGGQPPPRGWFDADVVKGEGGSDAILVHGGLAEDNSRLGDVWKLEFE